MGSRNRTLRLTAADRDRLAPRLLKLTQRVNRDDVADRILCQDALDAATFLPRESFDLLVFDAPYNIKKTFGAETSKRSSPADYAAFLRRSLDAFAPLLRKTATAYLCGDWSGGGALQEVAGEYFGVRNRITWEREKGRGARANWKAASEDVWFCTVSDAYTFHADAVKVRRRVVAPYRENGQPKDWDETASGDFRLTHPSNLWTDLTVPFWSMPENTDHPTQKPEKLVAKLVLASTNPGDFVLDPFLGSGTTAAVCRKLGRHFVGVERDREWALVAERRVELAAADPRIQGYEDGVFWERNSRPKK